jgi:hypothetical protein
VVDGFVSESVEFEFAVEMVRYLTTSTSSRWTGDVLLVRNQSGP